MMNVVTYQAPGGQRRLDICPKCERQLIESGRWPRDPRGIELCDVYKGLHPGVCDVHPETTDGEIRLPS